MSAGSSPFLRQEIVGTVIVYLAEFLLSLSTLRGRQGVLDGCARRGFWIKLRVAIDTGRKLLVGSAGSSPVVATRGSRLPACPQIGCHRLTMAIEYRANDLISDLMVFNVTPEDTTTHAMSNMTVQMLPVKTTADINMNLVRVICEVGISLPLAILGIIGNILAFVVLCRQKQRLTTNVLLQALAVADTLVLISSILLRSMRYVGWDSFVSVHHHIFIALYPCVYFFRLADTWLTVMMTIDRYIAVCHPLQAQRVCTLKRTYVTIAVILLSTLVFSIPRFFEYRLTPSRTAFTNTDLVQNTMYTMVYRISFFFLVMYLVPMTLLIVLNFRLMWTLRRAYANRSSMMSNGSKSQGARMGQRANRGVTVIVATVVTVCVLCNVTAMTAHVLWSLQICFTALRFLGNPRRLLANVSNIMVTLNCAINFVIYCLFSRKFRSGLRQTFHCESVRRLSFKWRAEHQCNSSGGANTSYTSIGLQPTKGTAKKPKPCVQQKASSEL